jgi:flagellar motor protein MotB
MKKLVAPALLGLVLWTSGCASEETYADLRRELDSQDRVIQELTRKNDDLVARTNVNETELMALRAENDALRGSARAGNRMDDVAAKLAQLEQDLSRMGGESGGFQAKPHQDGVAIEVAEILLFQPGKADLRAEGEALLKKLAARLASTTEPIRVEGHTDGTPVVQTRDLYPMGNLELSGRRALVVANFLITGGGLPADRVSYAGFGMHRPVLANAKGEDMARNRRVEIVLLRTKN